MLILNVYFVEIDCLIFGISQLESRLIKPADFGKQILMFCQFQRPTLILAMEP